MTPAELESQSQFADHTHVYLREYIQFADQKAAFVFAAAGALLAFLYGKGDRTRWMSWPTEWDLQSWLSLLAMALLAVASVFALAVVVPRRKGSHHGFIFWEAIADYPSAREYSSAAMQLTADTLVREKLQHCYELAAICRKKYRTLNSALRIGAAGAVLSMGYLLLF